MIACHDLPVCRDRKPIDAWRVMVLPHQHSQELECLVCYQFWHNRKRTNGVFILIRTERADLFVQIPLPFCTQTLWWHYLWQLIS